MDPVPIQPQPQEMEDILDMMGGHGLDLDGSGTGVGNTLKDFEAGQNSYTDLFSKELLEKGIISRRDCISRPLSMSNDGPIQIQIPKEGDYFVDPSSLRLNANFVIRKRTGGAGNLVNLVGDDAARMAPINMFTKAMIKDITVYINQTKISLISTPCYPIKAFIETACSYGRDAEKGHLQCSYWLKDTAGAHDTMGENDAITDRHAFIRGSTNVEMCETMHTELNTLNRLLPPGLDIQFIIELNNPNVYLQAVQNVGVAAQRDVPAVPAAPQDTYEVDYTDMYISYDRVALEPSLLSSIETRLNRNDKAIFPITRNIFKIHNVPAQQQSLLWQNLYTGQLPETVIIGMVDQDTWNEGLFRNYFNFQHKNLSEIQLRVNSQAIPSMPLKLNCATSKAYRAFRHFFDNIGIENSNTPCLISYEDFCQGATLIPFDLTPDKAATQHNHEKRTGNIEVDMKFREPLDVGITVFALCIFNDKFLITGPRMNREVILNPNLV